MNNEISNKMRIVVMYASVYDMPAEAGRDAMKGCTVNYYFLGNEGKALIPYSNDLDKEIGYQRSKVSLDYAMRAKIPVAPAIYDGYFEMTVNGQGKSVVKLVDLEYVENFDVSAMLVAMSAAGSKAPAAEKGTGNK